MISIQWNQETAELPLSEGVDHRTRLSEKLQNPFEQVSRLPYIDCSRSIPVESNLNYSQIIRRQIIDSCK